MSRVLFLILVVVILSAEAWPRSRTSGWSLSPYRTEKQIDTGRSLRGEPIAAPLWFLQSGRGKRLNVPGAWMMRTSRSEQNDNKGEKHVIKSQEYF